MYLLGFLILLNTLIVVEYNKVDKSNIYSFLLTSEP